MRCGRIISILGIVRTCALRSKNACVAVASAVHSLKISMWTWRTPSRAFSVEVMGVKQFFLTQEEATHSTASCELAKVWSLM